MWNKDTLILFELTILIQFSLHIYGNKILKIDK